jgi:hypothetical protein
VSCATTAIRCIEIGEGVNQKQCQCWWEFEDLERILGRPNPIAGDRMPCCECGKVWVYTPGDQQWRENPYPPGWVPDTVEVRV